MITVERLRNAGFYKSFKNGIPVYTRNGFNIIQTEGRWCPCTFLGGEVKIGELYLDTMQDLEMLIAETQY